MAFNVQYSFNNGLVTGTATSITALRTAIYNYAHSGSVSDDTGSDYSHLTQCTLSGTAEGALATGNKQGTSTGSSYGLFYDCSSLTSVDLSNLDTSKVTDMIALFNKCSSLTSVDLSSFNTSKVTTMRYMFENCTALTSLDLSSFDTSNVTYIDGMFDGCSALKSIKVNELSWNTNKVTSSSDMFGGCTQLPNYNSSYVDVTKAIDKSSGGYLDVIVAPIKYYKYYEHYSDGVRVIPKSTDMFDFVTQEVYDAIINPDPDMLYFIIE